MILRIQTSRLLKKRPSIFFILIIGFLILSCKRDSKKKAEAIKSEQTESEFSRAEKLVNEAISRAGGMNNWTSKKTLSYTKNIQSYDSTGTLIRTVAQAHKYQLRPSFKAYVSWEQNGSSHEIINTGKQAWKLVDGEIQQDEASVNSAWNSSFGSHYMVTMPFKLKDPGIILNYIGIDTLSSKKVVHKLKVTYEKWAGSSGGIHTWYYFINLENFQFEANFLDHGKGYSYTDYDTFSEVDGIMVTKERKSYASNEELEMLQLKTIYSNSDIQFDVEFPKNLFQVDN